MPPVFWCPMTSRHRLDALAIAWMLAGCQVASIDAAGSRTGRPTGNTAESSTSSTSGAMRPDLGGSSPEGSTSDGFSSAAFISSGDDCGDCVVEACDLWTQDCEAGEKCMSWANDGRAAPRWTVQRPARLGRRASRSSRVSRCAMATRPRRRVRLRLVSWLREPGGMAGQRGRATAIGNTRSSTG